MEVFSTVTAALDQSRLLVNVIRNQYRHMKRVPGKCGELEKGLNEMSVTLRELTEYERESMTPKGKREVKRMSEYLEYAKSKLEEQKSVTEGSSKVGRFVRAKRVSETLDELIGRLEELELRGLVIDGFAHQHASSNTGNDVFTAQYNVPPTPDSLVLNLNHNNTYEGRLKQKARTVDAVGARVTAAQGMSEVGKTCAVTAVGNDSDVQKCYGGGVYFLSFGKDAMDGDVIGNVANKVEESGGHVLADKIRNENDVEKAIEKGRGWYSGHKCLFICDNMWRCKGRESGICT